MDTSQHTHSLSAEQLEGFLQNKLSAEETKRVQSLLDDCELSRESLEGYALVPGAFADVAGLQKSIAAKSGMSSLSWFSLSAVVVAIGILSWAGVYIYQGDTPSVEAQTINPVVPSPEREITNLSPSNDHFVNPEAEVNRVIVVEKKEITADSQVDIPKETMMILPLPPTTLALTDSVVVVPQKAESAYNAQVGFIVDLKVTEFDKYYTTPIEVKEVPLTGTPARYEDDHGMVVDYEQEETVRLVPADQFLREGLIAFRDGRYGKCVSKMEVLLEHNPNDINALFYTAVSYVKLEMFSKAIPLLDKIILDPNNVFDEEAEWYRALALEGNGDTVAAKELFQKIAADGGFYAAQAKKKVK